MFSNDLLNPYLCIKHNTPQSSPKLHTKKTNISIIEALNNCLRILDSYSFLILLTKV